MTIQSLEIMVIKKKKKKKKLRNYVVIWIMRTMP